MNFFALWFVHKMEEFANANVVACNRSELPNTYLNSHGIHGYILLLYLFLHHLYIYAFHYIYILMSENSTVRIIHKFKFRRSIRKSIQISFQKVYMEGNKSEFK